MSLWRFWRWREISILFFLHKHFSPQWNTKLIRYAGLNFYAKKETLNWAWKAHFPLHQTRREVLRDERKKGKWNGKVWNSNAANINNLVTARISLISLRSANHSVVLLWRITMRSLFAFCCHCKVSMENLTWTKKLLKYFPPQWWQMSLTYD